jgi:general secretion pathway protein H
MPWTPGDNPDVLIFPGGEMTPFRLTVGEATGIAFNARGESLPERRRRHEKAGRYDAD